REAMRHVRAQEIAFDEPRDARENFTGPLRLNLVGCWNSHEFVVNRDVSIEQELAAVGGARARAEDRHDLTVDRGRIETLQKDITTHRIKSHRHAFVAGQL